MGLVNSENDEVYYNDDYDDDDHYDDDVNDFDDAVVDVDDDDDDDGFEDVVVENNGPTCKVITNVCLPIVQREDLQRTMELLSIREHQARTLLIHYRWDFDRVVEVFVDKGPDQLYKEACVMVHDDGVVSSAKRSSVTLCEICMEEFRFSKMTTMDCGHYFCNYCWKEHFVVKIKEGQSRRIKCMAYKCNVICDDDKIRSLVKKQHPDLAEKFERSLLESYIEDNKRVKWCPSVPHCGNAIWVKDDDCRELECKCGVQFCFKCCSEAHSPCSCQMWELWTKKCQDESENIKWMTVNTKSCPKCFKPVEKNGGCNLVRCVCGQPFCWLCGGATGLNHTWTSIANHTCGRYKEGHMSDVQRAKSDLLRYTHYHNRFQAHTDSLKAETTLKEMLEEKIQNMGARKLEDKYFDWVKNGANRLFRSRRILSYSYAFAYFLFGDTGEMTKEEKNIKQNLFEDQQQQFERHIETLSLFLEEPFDGYTEEKLMEFRKKIVDLSATTDSLCKNLYDCIDNEILSDLSAVINISPYQSKGPEKAVEID